MAINFSDAETEDNYFERKSEINCDSPQIQSSKREREDDEKWSPDTNEEPKKFKKMAFRWNWNDECIILENFYEFAGKNGVYSKKFYHFVKGKLSCKVSNSQLSDKVYRLKKRFLKDKCDMGDRKVDKYIDSNYRKLFEISSNIWGATGGDETPKTGGGPSSSQWIKAEEVNGYYEKTFKTYLENSKLDITCIPPDVMQEIRKEWVDVMIARNEYELKNAELLVEISDIRCSQNEW